MPQVSASPSIAAVTTTNVLSGLLFERVGGRGAQVKVYAVNATAALGELTATFIAGSDVICQDTVLTVDTGGVKIPDNQIASGVALPGDQLVLNVTNSHASTARVCHFIVDIENL